MCEAWEQANGQRTREWDSQGASKSGNGSGCGKRGQRATGQDRERARSDVELAAREAAHCSRKGRVFGARLGMR